MFGSKPSTISPRNITPTVHFRRDTECKILTCYIETQNTLVPTFLGESVQPAFEKKQQKLHSIY